jgi:hypothetical protein
LGHFPRVHPRGPIRRFRAIAHLAPGAIGAFYFYAEGSRDDPAFGFCDIELSVQRLASGRVRLELYCIADGYQSARGLGARHPLKIAVIAGDRVLAIADWHFSDVICGKADPMNFATDLDIAGELFAQVDRIELQATSGESRPCD